MKRTIASWCALLILLASTACGPGASPKPSTGGSAPASQQAAGQPAASQPAAGQPAAQAPAGAPAAASDPLRLTEAEEREVAGFYRGKTVRIIVGYAAGAGYDLFARTTARHMGRFLPGNPTIIVENMPGAGSLVAANHLYNVAPKDGTVFGSFDPALVLSQAVGGGGGAIQFDPAKVSWLGAPNSSTNICMVRADLGIDSVEKLIASPREIVFGSTGMGGATAILPSLLQHYLNAKLRIVTGYDGVAKVKLAVESGENDGTCGTYESFKSTHANWLAESPPYATIIAKSKVDPLGDLNSVPLLSNLLPPGEAQQVLALAMAPQAMGFLYAAPPSVPAARLKALRSAVIQTWNDPEYNADATKASLVPVPQDHQSIERLVSEVLNTPADVRERGKVILGLQ